MNALNVGLTNLRSGEFSTFTIMAHLTSYCTHLKARGLEEKAPRWEGPTTFEPCCEQRHYVVIERPAFPLSEYEWGRELELKPTH